MGLTVQQFFDYVDNMTENKPGVILKGKKGSYMVAYRVHSAHDKFFIDTINDLKSDKNMENRYVCDKEELQIFKVKIMELLKTLDIEHIYLE